MISATKRALGIADPIPFTVTYYSVFSRSLSRRNAFKRY